MLRFYGRKKLLPPCHGWLARPFPSFPKPLFQSKAKIKASDMKMLFYSDEEETHYHKKVLLLASLWKLRFLELGSGLLSWWAHDELHCGVPSVEQNNSGLYLKEFLVNYCSLSRLITQHDNLLLQFTRARLITIYYNFQFSTTKRIKFCKKNTAMLIVLREN